MNDQPLIESARLQFSGLSGESFDDPPAIGETRTYTVLARCTAHNERAMANEETRRSVTMKVERVLAGVDKSIDQPVDSEPSLFDDRGDDEPGLGEPAEGETQGDDERYVDLEIVGEDEPESVGSIMSGLDEFRGPEFSGADR